MTYCECIDGLLHKAALSFFHGLFLLPGELRVVHQGSQIMLLMSGSPSPF